MDDREGPQEQGSLDEPLQKVSEEDEEDEMASLYEAAALLGLDVARVEADGNPTDVGS